MASDRDRIVAVAWRWPVVFLLWLAPSASDLLRFLGPSRAALVVAVAALGIGAALVWTSAAPRDDDTWARRLRAAIGVALVLAFVGLYPLATSGRFGGGTDRADALDVTGAALLAGQPPYAALTYLGNHPTPMPGAVLLALPFHLIGSAAFQNLLWFYVLTRLAPRLIGDQRGAAAYLAIFVLFCPGVLLDFATGSDFATNAIYVAVAVFLASSLRADETAAVRALVYLFFAAALSSRPVYGVELPIVAAAIWRRQGRRRGFEALASTIVLAAALNLPILLDDPARFPLLLHANLLRFYPGWLHAAVTIPAASLGIACAGFLVDLRRGRIYLLSALSLAPMLAPSLLHALWLGAPAARLGIVSGYTLPLATFAGLWLLRPSREPARAPVGQVSGFPAPAAPLLQDVSA
jgi:hypothetical protein